MFIIDDHISDHDRDVEYDEELHNNADFQNDVSGFMRMVNVW